MENITYYIERFFNICWKSIFVIPLLIIIFFLAYVAVLLSIDVVRNLPGAARELFTLFSGFF